MTPPPSPPSPSATSRNSCQGIRDIFGCSHATAQRYKDTIIRDAVIQNGRKIVVDVELALQLFNQNGREAR